MHYSKIPKENVIRFKFAKRFMQMKYLAALLAVLLVLGGLWLYLNRYTNSTASFIFENIPILDTTPSKVNILLLGNAGGKHDGADLTDTIMVATIDPQSKRINLISLPRDLWLQDSQLKVNAIYAYGKKQGQGLKTSKEKIGNILGLPIHHAVRIDFNGFIRAIDELGGIDVEVEKSFDDYLYPITGKENDLCGLTELEKEFSEEEAKSLNIELGKRKVFIDLSGKIATDAAVEDNGYKYFACRYEHLSFEKGIANMDGETALKFVRSRHGTNGEGSDFARAKRQQKVLEAVREKVLSVETLVNPNRIAGVINALGQSFETDIPIIDVLDLYSVVKRVSTVNSYILGGSGGESLFIHPQPSGYGGAWVLTPKGGDFTIVQNYIKDIINGEVNNNESTIKPKESSSSARSGNSSF